MSPKMIFIPLAGILILIVSLFLFWRIWFLRDPERKIPKGKNIVSPADGKVVEVLKISGKKPVEIHKRYVGGIRTLCSDVSDSCYLISIFMNVFDVHINRAPLRGKVISVRHKPGRFRAVFTLSQGLENEKSEMLLDTSIGRVKVIQVAGLLARRIINNAGKGQILGKGERYGLINLGSQLIVILPEERVSLLIKKGDRVRAGESILAKISGN